MRSIRISVLGLLFVALAGGAFLGCDLIIDTIAKPADDEGFVEVNGARIYYQIQGQGEPLVLVHGYPLSGDLFREQREGLSHQYKVITLDLRGYGRSEAPGEEPQATIETYANDVLDVMTELGVEKALIGGMSMGGPIILSMYDMAPERFRGMLLIDTIAAPANAIEAATWRGAAELVRNMGVEALPPLIIDEMLTGETRMERPELAEYLIGIMNQASKQAALAGLEALATRPDFRPLLGRIDVPVLVLVGLQDTIYPYEISQGMAEMIGDNAEVAILDDASHAAIIEAGEAANKAILDWAKAAI